MTYGWMLLVVAVAGGTIFSVVGDQSIESSLGFTGGDIDVSNFGLSQNQALNFEIRNTASETIEIEQINLTDEEGKTSSFNHEVLEFPVAEEGTLSVPGLQTSDSTNTINADIRYSMGNLEGLETIGTITGNIEVKNITQKRLEYEWFDTEEHYDAEGHPGTTEEMNEFFKDDNGNISLEGEGLWGENDADGINWANNDDFPDDKPSYLKAKKFSWKVEGMIFVPESGEYSFGVDSDDASDLYIDGQKVTDWYGEHGTEPGYSHNNNIELDAGLHSFKARMQEGTGEDSFAVGWEKPGESGIDTIQSTWYYIEG